MCILYNHCETFHFLFLNKIYFIKLLTPTVTFEKLLDERNKIDIFYTKFDLR
jgi:hypothetical protein